MCRQLQIWVVENCLQYEEPNADKQRQRNLTLKQRLMQNLLRADGIVLIEGDRFSMSGGSVIRDIC